MIDVLNYMVVFGGGVLFGMLFAGQLIDGSVRMTIKHLDHKDHSQ